MYFEFTLNFYFKPQKFDVQGDQGGSKGVKGFEGAKGVKEC